MSLPDYLKTFRQAVGKINDYGFAESVDIREELRASKQAVITAKIVLVDGSVLQIKEFIDAKYKVEKLTYAYHYQNRKGKLIFR